MAISSGNLPRLTRVRQARGEVFAAAMAIYDGEIPKAEQKTQAQIAAGLAHPDVRFWAYRRGGAVIGMSVLYAPRRAGVMLLEYLAIAAFAQGGGIGSALFMASLEASRTDPAALLLIEVDCDAAEISEAERKARRRRKDFYRRHGCREVKDFDYILPLENYRPAPAMNLLVHGEGSRSVETARLRQAVSAVYQNVYGCGSGDLRIAAMFAGRGDRLSLI